MLIKGEISSDDDIEMISRHPGGKLTRRPVAKDFSGKRREAPALHGAIPAPVRSEA
jgi:hypothetical protein